MSFLRYFFSKMDATSADGDGEGVESIESNRKRIASVRKRNIKNGANLDLGRRTALLESQLADAGLVIESLIELLEEKIGLSRKEIEVRIEKLSVTPVVRIEPARDTAEPSNTAPPVLAPEDEKERFQPRRRWRDARGQL